MAMLRGARQAGTGRLRYVGIDYDQTITCHDTCAAIAATAIGGRPASQALWQDLVTQLQAASAELPSFLPEPGLTAFDPLALNHWLQAMESWDSRANARLEASRVLAGSSREELESLGRTVELQTGAAEVLQLLSRACVERGSQQTDADGKDKIPRVEIVSASWSTEMLEASITQALGMPASKAALALPVFANRMLPEGAGAKVSDGLLKWRVRSAVDKANLVALRRKSLGGPVAFIGDSLGDLGALLEADLGIVLGTSSSLRSAAAKLAVQADSVSSLVERCAHQGTEPWKLPEGKALYWANSWAEVSALLLGQDFV
eukprot:TRINITY_DN79265_c0_g1_i1.p1 TRINITY_DN79265_c0_g1~~TRINITY_DN79265_c0_g1_i1.p1  ORF type:complete len:338 (-),score=74.01 TRINITY_DN79265_c0_g1_i1:46-999(-)